jgi:hypothetical protein
MVCTFTASVFWILYIVLNGSSFCMKIHEMGCEKEEQVAKVVVSWLSVVDLFSSFTLSLPLLLLSVSKWKVLAKYSHKKQLHKSFHNLSFHKVFFQLTLSFYPLCLSPVVFFIFCCFFTSL